MIMMRRIPFTAQKRKKSTWSTSKLNGSTNARIVSSYRSSCLSSRSTGSKANDNGLFNKALPLCHTFDGPTSIGNMKQSHRAVAYLVRGKTGKREGKLGKSENGHGTSLYFDGIHHW